jgi:hypothetical protein
MSVYIQIYVLNFFYLLEQITAYFDQHQSNDTCEEWKHKHYIEAS